MKLIETKTLGTAAASIEFTSIPQTFTDLVIFISGRSDKNSNGSIGNIAAENVGLYPNSATFPYASASNRILYGIGTGVASTTQSNYIHAGTIPVALATSNTFGNTSLYITNYSASAAKSISIDSVTENNASSSWQSIQAANDTSASAYTSLKFDTSGGNFVAGTTISLYGITKGSDGIVTTS